MESMVASAGPDLTGINRQDLAGHSACSIAGQEGGSSGDIIRFDLSIQGGEDYYNKGSPLPA